MTNLRILIPVCLSSLLILANARDDNEHEHEAKVVAAIDPATEVRLGKLQRDDLLKKYHISTNQAYIDAVNRIGRRIANTLLYERPDLIDDWVFTVVDAKDVNC